MMYEFAKVLKQYRLKAGLKQLDLAEKSGVTGSYICLLEVGKRPPPSDEVAMRMEKALGIEPKTLVKLAHYIKTPPDVREEMDVERVYVKGRIAASEGKVVLRHIPLINKVAAGYPVDMTDLDYPVGVADEYVMVPDVADPLAFAVTVCGDSMAPRFWEGDVLVISPAATVTSGDFCFIRLGLKGENKSTFKQVYFEEGQVKLVALNSAYQPQLYRRDEITGIYRAVKRVESL